MPPARRIPFAGIAGPQATLMAVLALVGFHVGQDVRAGYGMHVCI